MPEDISPKPHTIRSTTDLTTGDLVRIRQGALRGLTAQIAGFTAERNCILVSETFPSGVRIVVGSHLLARVPENATLLAGQ